ncbi:hypothetical protein ACJJTC_000658 [Scirpophaga incertulas]
MKLLIIVALIALAYEASARAQDDGEARVAPSRGLLKLSLGKAKSTTTTTTLPPQDEVEYEDEADYAEEGLEPSTEAPPSSTEGKKLVGSGVRPFRSNADLLETLKRRRAQAVGVAKHSTSSVPQPQESPTETPVKANFSKKRYNAPTRESNNEEIPAPAKPGRGRFGRPSTRAVQEPEADEQFEAAPPSRSGRGFPRRGLN